MWVCQIAKYTLDDAVSIYPHSNLKIFLPTSLIPRTEWILGTRLRTHVDIRFDGMATSFKKKGASKPSHPRGTRPSLHNAQLLVSSGVPSLDVLLGTCILASRTLFSKGAWLARLLERYVCLISIKIVTSSIHLI